MLQGEHSAILSTFIKLPFVKSIFVLSMFEWPLKAGFTVIVTVFQDITNDEMLQLKVDVYVESLIVNDLYIF